MPYFRKKPVTVEAMQFDGTPESATAIIKWALSYDGTIRYHHAGEPGEPRPYLAIDTIEGTMRAEPGDSVIRETGDAFRPCRVDIFAETYEPAPEPAPATRWKAL